MSLLRIAELELQLARRDARIAELEAKQARVVEPVGKTLLSRATDLHEKAQMPWSEAEALALSEAGITLSTIDELIGNSAYRGVDSLLTTPDDIRKFTCALLVHSCNIDSLYTTPQAAAQPSQAAELSDEEILHLVDTHVGGPNPSYPLDNSDWINFAKAVTAAINAKAAKP